MKKAKWCQSVNTNAEAPIPWMPRDESLTTPSNTVKISEADLEKPDMSANAATKTANPYVIDFHSMEKSSILGKTSTGEGASFNGDRIYCGLVTKKKGTGSRAHFHPDE